VEEQEEVAHRRRQCKMDLFDRINMRIDYNNHYMIEKALKTLVLEFNRSVAKDNVVSAQNIIVVVKKMYDKLSQTYRESAGKGETMSYSQKIMAQKMRGLISGLSQQVHGYHEKENNQQIT